MSTDSLTAALSRACASSARTAEAARSALLADTIAYAARLIRAVLPTAAAITVDTEERELNEVRDAEGKTLWYAPASLGHAFNDGLVDDVDDLFRQAIPFGGLVAAGWKSSDDGFPYRDVQLPEPPAEKRHTRAYVLHEGLVCHVHVDLTPADTSSLTVDGLHGSVLETRDRVRAAILNSGYDWPEGELTVTLHGSGYPSSSADLAIACAILAAAGHVNPRALKRTVLIGELGLDGRVRDPRGSIRYADICGGYKRVIVASSAAATCPVVAGGSLHAVVDLRQALEVLALPLNY